MKRILVATDFSKAADRASEYAVELARAFNAELILFSAYQVPIPTVEGSIVIPDQKVRTETKQQLQNKAKLISAAYNITVEFYSGEGPATSAILKAAKESMADVIITGMKANDKRFRDFFGSTITGLARTSTIPLIVVPQESMYKYPATIALAYDADVETDTDVHLLNPLREIAERFNSDLYLVHVFKTPQQDAFELFVPPLRLSKMMRTLDLHNENLQGKDITGSLNLFIEQHKINLLALLPHKHSLFERFFIKSTTRSMIFETQIPLLILPELTKKKDQTKQFNREVMY